MTEWKVFERGTFYVKNGILKGKEVGVGGGGGAVRKTRNRPGTPRNTLRTPWNTPELPPDWLDPTGTPLITKIT